eukprot:5446141-Amphidinium_carterae.1
MRAWLNRCLQHEVSRLCLSRNQKVTKAGLAECDISVDHGANDLHSVCHDMRCAGLILGDPQPSVVAYPAKAMKGLCLVVSDLVDMGKFVLGLVSPQCFSSSTPFFMPPRLASADLGAAVPR